MDANVTRLSRDTLLRGYMDRIEREFFVEDSELMAARKAMLETLVREDVLEVWLKGKERIHREVATTETVTSNLMTFDAKGYHPDDKNFNYYKEYTGNTLTGLLGSPNMRHSNLVSALAFSPDGKYVVSASWDSTIKIWLVESGAEVRTFKGHTNWVNSVSFSPDGGFILSGSRDMTLKLWNARTGDCLHTIPLPWIPKEVKWFPKGSGKPGWVGTANLNGTVSLFDVSRFMKDKK